VVPGISIKLRLSIWYSSVLLLALLLFGCGMWIALQHRLIRGVDGRLAAQVDAVRMVVEGEGIATNPNQIGEEISEVAGQSGVIQVRMENGESVASGGRAPLDPELVASVAPSYRTLEMEGRPSRAVAQQISADGRTLDVLVALPLDDVDRTMRDFRDYLLLMIPAALMLSGLGGWWVSRRALAPVDEITSVARSITERNLSQRLTVPQTGDELQRMSETWNEVLARLESALERLRRLTADASHELRTPVAVIRATAELALRRERDPEQYRQSLREIESEAERMTGMISGLLMLAAADANRLEMPLASTDMNLLTAEAVEENRPLADAKSICLRSDLRAHPASAPANDGAMRRLLRILIDNAVKFTPKGGVVLVSTACDRGGITVSVRDSGQGISWEALPHIFERFYRSDPPHGESSGAGLGLAIAQRIAQVHGAEIRVESSPGAGSCFQFTLKN
jgi:heavy metal sensor kinase